MKDMGMNHYMSPYSKINVLLNVELYVAGSAGFL
jgi:hypothetical protein